MVVVVCCFCDDDDDGGGSDVPTVCVDICVEFWGGLLRSDPNTPHSYIKIKIRCSARTFETGAHLFPPYLTVCHVTMAN